MIEINKEYKADNGDVMIINSADEDTPLAVEVFIRNGSRVETSICSAGSYYLFKDDLRRFIDSLKIQELSQFNAVTDSSTNILRIYGEFNRVRIRIVDMAGNYVRYILEGSELADFIADLKGLE